MLLRFVAFILILWYVGKTIRAVFRTYRGAGRPLASPPGALVQDPCCGVYFDPKTAARSVSSDGKTTFFCSMKCFEQFHTDPPEGGRNADPPAP